MFVMAVMFHNRLTLTFDRTFRYMRAITMTMRIQRGLPVLMALVCAGNVFAQGSTATQTLSLEVRPISKIAVSGNPNALVITTAQAGSDLTTVQDENTTYSVTTNLDNMKIVASINSQMPSGTKLLMQMRSTKGTSRGVIDISNALSPLDLVAGIGRGNDQNQSISYVFAAEAHVAEIPSESRVVTLTLTN